VAQMRSFDFRATPEFPLSTHPGRSPQSPSLSVTTGFAALSPPPDRDDRPPFPPAAAAPEPHVEVENLCRGAEPDPQQRLWRQQRDLVADCAIDLDEVPSAEVLNPRAAAAVADRVVEQRVQKPRKSKAVAVLCVHRGRGGPRPTCSMPA